MKTTALALTLLIALGAAVSGAASAPPANVAEPGDAKLKAVEQAIAEYGKPAVVEYLLEIRHRRITVEVDGTLRPSLGPPNKQLVTAASVLHDLAQAQVDPLRLKDELAKRRPPEERDLKITQDSLETAAASPAPQAATATGDVLSQDDCFRVARRVGAQSASQKGCSGAEATSVSLHEAGDASRHPRYLVKGTCSGSGDAGGTFEAIVKCYVSPMPGWIESERGGGKIRTKTEAAPVSSRVESGAR